MSMNWRGSSLKAMRWRALRTELKAVRLATVLKKMNQEHHPKPVFWKKRTVADAVDALVTEDGVLTEVSKSTGLLKEGGGKTVSVGLVVDELRGNVVVDLL